MGLSTREKEKLDTYQLKMWPKLGMSNGGITVH